MAHDMAARDCATRGPARAGAASPDDAFVFRAPVAEDGPAITRLVAACPPLDHNSRYCILLQCTHFADTCLLAEWEGDILGWISGYRPPSEPEAMFVWQVAVDERARGCGLGKRLLGHLLERPGVRDAKRLIATVGPSNDPSRRMFAGLAARFGLDMEVCPHFESDTHFGGAHEAEQLISIGPLDRARRGSVPAHPTVKQKATAEGQR